MKGEGSTVLIYALTAVMGAVVLIFGYKVLAGLIGSSDKVMLTDFRTEFAQDVDLASSYDAVRTKTYHLPSSVNEICIIDRTESSDLDASAYPIVHDSWQSNARENVFLLPIGEQFAVDPVHFSESERGRRSPAHLCMNTKGTLTLRFIGEGNATRIVAAQ